MSQRCPKHDSLTHCFPFANANVESTTIRIIVPQLLNFKDAECNRPLLKKNCHNFYTNIFNTKVVTTGIPGFSNLGICEFILESVNSSCVPDSNISNKSRPPFVVQVPLAFAGSFPSKIRCAFNFFLSSRKAKGPKILRPKSTD